MSEAVESERKSGKKPTHIAKHPREYRANGEKRIDWTRIGVAWASDDGSRISLQLDCVPLDGVVVLWKPKANEQ